MKKSLLSLMVLLSTAVAGATSLNPCTPTVPYQPITMTCFDQQYFYSVDIQITHSPLTARCSGKNYIERKTAKVAITDRDTSLPVATVQVFNDAFAFDLNVDGSTFQSPALKMDFKNCVAPMNVGGVSIGNFPRR